MVVEPSFSSRTETDWTIDNTWKATQGSLGTFQPDDYLNDQAGPAFATWMATASHWGGVRLTKLSLYPAAGSQGKSVGGNVCTLNYNTPVAGTGSGNPLPLENSAAISWKTHRIGPRGRGRIYSPVSSVGVIDAVGKIDDTKRQNMADEAAALLEGLAYDGVGTAGAHVRPVVTGPSTSGGLGAFTDYATIIGVSVGSIMDTQRRRRAQEVEVRSVATPSY
jgi:hypothetical protein